MRFQCRIGTGTVRPVPSAASAKLRRIEPPSRPAAASATRRDGKRRHKLARGAIASAVLLVAVGCATLEPGSTKPWKVEPVFNVTHSARSSQAYYTLGQYFDGSMRWDKAIDAYRKAIAADAQNIDAYDALGVALAQAGHLDDAESILRQAAALAPERLRIRNNLGYVLLLADKPGEAVVVLKSVVDQDSRHAIATANLSQAMARSNGVAGSAVVAVPATAEAPAGATTQVAAAPVRETPSVAVGYQPTPAAAATPAAPPASSALPAPPAAPVSLAPQAPRLEVSNGNGMTGMAARVGRWLAAHGVAPERLSNRKPFAQRSTVVQYRAGQQDAALRVVHLLPADAKAESQPTAGLRSDVRVVLGHDWVQTAACLERNTCRPPATAVAIAVER